MRSPLIESDPSGIFDVSVERTEDMVEALREPGCGGRSGLFEHGTLPHRVRRAEIPHGFSAFLREVFPRISFSFFLRVRSCLYLFVLNNHVVD